MCRRSLTGPYSVSEPIRWNAMFAWNVLGLSSNPINGSCFGSSEYQPVECHHCCHVVALKPQAGFVERYAIGEDRDPLALDPVPAQPAEVGRVQ